MINKDYENVKIVEGDGSFVKRVRLCCGVAIVDHPLSMFAHAGLLHWQIGTGMKKF
jgi:hypothetical protein